jgi:hypothetical protein
MPRITRPKKFDYAAVRVGNTYVLPPDEDDVKAFRRKRRRELTRRGFVLAGVAALLGAVALPLLPWSGPQDPIALLNRAMANDDYQDIRQLCLELQYHPSPELRQVLTRAMALFPTDPEIRDIYMRYIESDPNLKTRECALDNFMMRFDTDDFPTLAAIYHRYAWARPVIDAKIQEYRFKKLDDYIKKHP